MITQLAPRPRISKEFVVCDIENRSTGALLPFDTYDGKTHTVCSSWEEWIDFITLAAKHNRAYRTIYAHNGGGWDWLSLIEWMVQSKGTNEFQTIQNGTRIIAVNLPVAKDRTIKLCDSWFILAGNGFNGKLKDLIEKNAPHRKKVFTYQDGKLPEWYWDNDREHYWAGLYADTEGLYDCLCNFADIVHTKIAPIGRLGLTVPSTAMKCFQTCYLDRQVSTPDNPKVRAMLRAAYNGGRVEAFQPGYFPQVNVYDINSLYPSVMATTPVPVSARVTFTSRLQPEKCGVYHVRFQQVDRSKLPVLMVAGLGAYAGEGFYFSNELRRLLDCAGGRIEVLDGFYFEDSDVLFRQWVDKLYALRLTDRKGPLGNTCKLCMNALYGKFAQKPVRSKTIHTTDPDVLDKYATYEVLSAEWGIYRVFEAKQAPFEHVGIAGTITSEARARLWESFGQDHSGVVYCDTDSVHCLGQLPNDPDKLGALKHEFTGEGVYLGKKLYGLRDSRNEKIRAKGIRVGSKENSNLILDFDTLRGLLTSEEIRAACTFQTATTFTAVLKGERACVFQPRTRRIRVTANGPARANRSRDRAE